MIVERGNLLFCLLHTFRSQTKSESKHAERCFLEFTSPSLVYTMFMLKENKKE
jgi:hypothetical protein